jgi:glycosyltransferase involved in cell wall biosynthesis
LYESVPPRLYGGTERVVHYLTEELVRRGHEVTLFASGDSQTRARLIAPCTRALRLDKNCLDRMAHHILQLEMVQSRIDEFDVVHYHIDYFHYPFSRRSLTPHVTTLHGRLDLVDLVNLYKEFVEIPLVSISNSQRRPLPWANWAATVHHGLPLDLYHFHEAQRNGAEPYLAFLGRIAAEKRVDRAIEIAFRLGMKLKIAAKIDRADAEYFGRIKHLFDLPNIEYVGEIREREKNDFLGNAHALLFPIDWCEPFGLVMIEAMACGTPIVAWRCGSVPEVIEEGVSGYAVESIEEAMAAVRRVVALDRRQIRHQFEKRFSVARMTSDYLAVYQRLQGARVIEPFEEELSSADA